MENKLEEIKNICIDGLLTDGGHHKQWYLEQILEEIGVDLVELRETLKKDDFSWEKGIAP